MLVGTGWSGAAVLLAFFVSSNLADRLLPRRAGPPPDGKGDCRDQWQVLANGAAAAAGGLLGLHDRALGLAVVTASLAAAGADTWATAWGGLARTPPRHVLTGRPVPPGTSGGITLVGSSGALLGAVLVAAVGASASRTPFLLPVGALVGFLGMLADSVLGAALQGRFRCARCEAPSERPRHRCGRTTDHVGGLAWLTNDGVNALTTALAGLAGAAAWGWLAR